MPAYLLSFVQSGIQFCCYVNSLQLLGYELYWHIFKSLDSKGDPGASGLNGVDGSPGKQVSTFLEIHVALRYVSQEENFEQLTRIETNNLWYIGMSYVRF